MSDQFSHFYPRDAGHSREADRYRGQRVAVLVDTANMYHSAKKNFDGGRLNYQLLLDEICGARALVRAIAFVVTVASPDDDGRGNLGFIEALRKTGFETREKIIHRYPDGYTRGGDWDVGLALCAAELSTRVDTIALVSGDGDFVELIEYLKAHGIRTEVYAFEGSVSSDLVRRADHSYQLGEEWLL